MKSKETRCIKFHLDKSVNKSKKDKILKFLNECNLVQNQLYEKYWNDENFKIIIYSKDKMSFNRNMEFTYRDFTPILKSHHFQQISQQVFSNLKSIQSNIMNDMHFSFEDKELQSFYNYCKGFCFKWDDLNNYVNKQIKKNKSKLSYYEFLIKIKDFISDSTNYNKLKNDIEESFWEKKSKTKLPNKKEFQILCNSSHTLDYEIKEFQWIFIIDNNDRIGGSDRRGVYDKMIIPVKYTNYHKNILYNKTLLNTFNLKLSRNGSIEIIANYEVEIKYPKNEITQEAGIDIGLKKLITSSDGEIVDQNKAIINKLNRLNSNKINRKHLEKHLRKKYNNDEFKLSNKRYLKREYNLTCHVICDNRYRIKQFLKGRENFNIIMEDLHIVDSGMNNRKVNQQLRRLMIQQIKNDIIKYSKVQGNKVSLINPAYTSGTSVLDNELPIKDNYNKTRRIKRGLFKSNNGILINSDVNGSMQIMRKVNPNAFDSYGLEGCLSPIIIKDIFSCYKLSA